MPRDRGPQKVGVIQTLVESRFSWTAGAVHWGGDDLRALNTLQLHCSYMYCIGHLISVDMLVKHGSNGIVGLFDSVAVGSQNAEHPKMVDKSADPSAHPAWPLGS